MDKPQIRRDCARLMLAPILLNFLELALGLIFPSAIADAVGQMTELLLALDAPGIRGILPGFLTAILLQVFLVPLLTLGKNIFLTRQGTAYDRFLMDSSLRMPYSALHSIDAGEYIHRFEVDRTLYYLSVVRLYSVPGALLLYGGFLVYYLRLQESSPGYLVCILALCGSTILFDTLVSSKKAALQRDTSAYEATRKDLELEAYSLKDFAKGYRMDRFLVSRLRQTYGQYWKKTGSAQGRLTALSQVFAYWGNYGIYGVALLYGAFLLARGQLTVRALTCGYLLFPMFKQAWECLLRTVQDRKLERQLRQRVAYFYQDWEADEAPAGTAAVIALRDVSFSYPGVQAPVLSHMELVLDSTKNYQLFGKNGSGKSTLLNLLSGTCQPTAGSLADATGTPLTPQALRDSVTLLEQNNILFSGTVWENFFLPEDRKEEAAALLREFGFQKSLDFSVTPSGKNLSPGEQKKVLLARCLLRNTPFLILDEPFNHLDAPCIQALLRHLRARGGGILIVSHQPISPQDLPLQPLQLGG